MRSFGAFMLVVGQCLMSGCANSAVVQISPGVYELARGDTGGVLGSNEALKAEVMEDANVFAERKGKVAIPVSAREQLAVVAGDWTYFTYDFKVVYKGSPEAKVPKILVLDVRPNSLEAIYSGGDVTYTAQPLQFPKGTLTVNPDSVGH